MAKTQKERAFLRDLYINEEWTRRFTDLVDKNLVFKKAENVLYINAGTGDHCFQLREKLDDKIAIFARCESQELAAIARDKAIAVKSDVDFSTMRFDDDAFDIVVADATLIAPPEIGNFVSDAVRVTRPGGKTAVFLPSAGSYGEVFSLLWEVLFEEDLGEHGHAAEAMIAEIPTVSRIEEIASAAGLTDIKSYNAREVFEFENGEAFISSPLVADFLLSEWLKTLKKKDRERVNARLAKLIDAEDGDLTFRFSVKATLVTGEKG
ncbi:MAG: class I SAM-dependent methyltransferase [Acidobacteria bacterium]|nr:class I SAM-dependent methyltransferase [Acidobacteriota bacterium]